MSRARSSAALVALMSLGAFTCAEQVLTPANAHLRVVNEQTLADLKRRHPALHSRTFAPGLVEVFLQKRGTVQEFPTAAAVQRLGEELHRKSVLSKLDPTTFDLGPLDARVTSVLVNRVRSDDAPLLVLKAETFALLEPKLGERLLVAFPDPRTVFFAREQPHAREALLDFVAQGKAHGAVPLSESIFLFEKGKWTVLE